MKPDMMRAVLARAQAIRKQAFVPFSEPAMTAPQAPPQGAPVDTAMAQGGAPVPQQGAPMDPAMAQGGAPMPTPISPEAAQFLMSQGAMQDQTGNWVDPSGQPIPPDILMQIEQMVQQQGGAPMPPQGAPMDPAQGAPVDPSQDPMVNFLLDAIAQIVEGTMQEQLSNMDKRIAALTDNIQAVRSIIEDYAVKGPSKDRKEDSSDSIADEVAQGVAQYLGAAQQGVPVPEVTPQEAAQGVPPAEIPPEIEQQIQASMGF